MPIWLRRYTFQKLQDYYKERNEATEKQEADLRRQASKLKVPNYRAKAPKK